MDGVSRKTFRVLGKRIPAAKQTALAMASHGFAGIRSLHR